MKSRTGRYGPPPRESGDFRKTLTGWTRLAVFLCSSALKLLHFSWKIEVSGLERLEHLDARGERLLVLFWHGKYIPFFSILRGRGACIFASLSRRGEIISGICRRFGHQCVLIPEGPGDGTTNLMRRALEGRSLAAMVPDGPLGPCHRVKHGVIRLAGDLGMILLPASASARPRLVLARRWDRMEVPLPFSRVRLVIGEPIAIPQDLGGRPMEWWEERVGEALETAGAEAERGGRVSGER